MQQLITQKQTHFINLDAMSILNPCFQIPNTMASLFPIFHITFLMIISLPSTTHSQDTSFPNPSIAQCTSSLLPLAPCVPFVQGLASSPGQPCCDNLKLLYIQVPRCLCVLQNVSSSFPINRTLALQLPVRCTLQVNVSDCLGVKLPSNSPPTQASNGTKGNPSVAASPGVPMTPKPSIIGLGLARSRAINLKAGDAFVVALTVAILLLAF